MHPAHPRPPCAARARAAFTLMELLVVVSIILVLAAIALPVYSTVLSRANKAVAINNMRQVTAALISYAGQNDGNFPDENIIQGSSWANAAGPLGDKVWFNVLPRMLGKKSVGDYANNPSAFYTKDNLLFLPGATYPLATRNNKPSFAFALNSKLQRKSKGQGNTKLSQVTNPARTVVFLEEGINGETQAMPRVQAAYEGEQKTSARSFVERYGGQGVITFLDGHAETLAVKDILNARGLIKVPPECTTSNVSEKTHIVWTRAPEEDPN